VTTPEAQVAVAWAGAEPYFMHRTAIDLLGKCDPRIAKEPMRRPPATGAFVERALYFWPGHLKFDYDYSIGQLRPDVVTQLWLRRDQAQIYITPAYVSAFVAAETLFVRRDSPHIRWDELGRLLEPRGAHEQPSQAVHLR
jgi:hypothetical protein